MGFVKASLRASGPPLGALPKAAVVLEVFLAAGALGGGGALILGPRGEIIPLPLSALEGSPFETYLVPGLILFLVLGIGPLVAAALALRRHPFAPLAAAVVGAALLIWLAVEIAIVGYTNDPPLQIFYLFLGAVIAAVGLLWRTSRPTTPWTPSRWRTRAGGHAAPRVPASESGSPPDRGKTAA